MKIFQPNFTGSATGSIISASQISGSFFGNGAGLTGVSATSAPAGPNQAVQFNDAGTVSGSGNFQFNKTTNIVILTGSIQATGSSFNFRVGAVTASIISASTGFTGSLLGTASWAVSASRAVTASYILNAVTASYVLNAQSASLAANSTLFSGRAVTTFAGTGSNTFVGDQVITGSLLISGSNGAGLFSKGGTIAEPVSGISVSSSYLSWIAPFPCEVVSMFGRRTGGTAPEVNARRSGSAGYALHSGSSLTLTTADAWTQFNSVQNTAYVIGDSLELVMSGSGNTQIAVQVNFRKT